MKYTQKLMSMFPNNVLLQPHEAAPPQKKNKKQKTKQPPRNKQTNKQTKKQEKNILLPFHMNIRFIKVCFNI